MSPKDDRRPVQGGGGHVEAGQADSTIVLPRRQDATRRAEPVNVWAHAYLVVGTRGRCRLVLVVPSCVFCGRLHAHNGQPDFTVGKRTASCHEGRYVLHVGTLEGEAAA